jgi:hypothetical protein
MKNLFLSFLILLFASALFAQQRDSTIVKPHCKLKSEFSFAALYLKENENKYWPYYKKFAPHISSFQPNNYLKIRDLQNIKGVEFQLNYGVVFKRIKLKIGIGYRSSIRYFYADSIQINPLTLKYTDNLKYQEEIKKTVLNFSSEFNFFERKAYSCYIMGGFEKNVQSQNVWTISNNDYYNKANSKPDFQDFEYATIGFSKMFEHFSISLPLTFETSFYNKNYLIGYKQVFFYYKTGLIISFFK